DCFRAGAAFNMSEDQIETMVLRADRDCSGKSQLTFKADARAGATSKRVRRRGCEQFGRIQSRRGLARTTFTSDGGQSFRAGHATPARNDWPPSDVKVVRARPRRDWILPNCSHPRRRTRLLVAPALASALKVN